MKLAATHAIADAVTDEQLQVGVIIPSMFGSGVHERVARAVAACAQPVISAVGHEVDLTICDLVADHRAATPSSAAEAAVPLQAEVEDELRTVAASLRIGMQRRLDGANERLAAARSELAERVVRGAERRRARIEALAGRLNALSPLATLARGYAVARDGSGATLPSVERFQRGMPFELLLRDGRVRATTDVVERADATRDAATGQESA
jgi:exodeoxyribonuclease VII large subunit